MPNDHANSNADSITVIINGQQILAPKGEVTHFDLVKLAYPNVTNEADASAYSITYDRGHEGNHSGVLPVGASIKLKKDMEIDVVPTGMS